MKPSEARNTGGGAATTADPSEQPRPAASRARRLGSAAPIREAAARLFLQKGYPATSMDDVAAAARVSKQTIYTHFATKEELFADLVLASAGRVDEFTTALTAALADGDVEAGLGKQPGCTCGS